MTPQFTIRPAQSDDVPTLFQLIQALAEYENLSHQVTGTVEQLRSHLFGEQRCIEAIVAESTVASKGQAIGFALFFTHYSTFLTKPGLYLEDLFVLPDYRSCGVGKALLSELAKLARSRNYGRMEWSVLDWNEPAIGFYQRIGATVMPDWRICRVTGEAIDRLAEG